MSTLILLPGLHGTAALFTPLLREIPPEIPTRTLQYPRHQTRTYKQLFTQLEQDLHDLPSMILIAESFSGPLALQFALKHPARVRALILCVTFIHSPVPPILGWLAAPFALISFPLPGFLIKMFLAGASAPRDVVTNARREVRASKSHVIAHRVLSAVSVNASAALKSCTTPILCLAASRDRLIGTRSHRRILRARPDITHKTLDGPHLLLQVNPAAVWREMSAFLGALEPQLTSPTA